MKYFIFLYAIFHFAIYIKHWIIIKDFKKSCEFSRFALYKFSLIYEKENVSNAYLRLRMLYYGTLGYICFVVLPATVYFQKRCKFFPPEKHGCNRNTLTCLLSYRGRTKINCMTWKVYYVSYLHYIPLLSIYILIPDLCCS